MEKVSLYSRKSSGVGSAVQPLAFSGNGFIPDLMSENGIATLPSASKTVMEGGVPGGEGMLPPPGFIGRSLVPGYIEGGTGGAGSFHTSQSAPKERA